MDCNEKQSLNRSLLSRDFSNFLKGVCALIVIMVHIPASHGNAIQDAIGSFAYVCVTIFFMISAYGMLLSSRKRGMEYVSHFWRNRLSSLLIPCIVVNVVFYSIMMLMHCSTSPSFILTINPYVSALLQWCLLFYFVEVVRLKTAMTEKTADIILASGVVTMSLVSYFFFKESPVMSLTWSYERMGLLWGLLIYRYEDRLIQFCSRYKFAEIFCMFILALVLGILYLKYKYVFFAGEYLLKVVLGLALIALTLYSGYTIPVKWNAMVFRWLSSVSFIVYLSHVGVMFLLDKSYPDLSSWVFIGATYIITLCLSSILTPVCGYSISFLRRS